MLKSKLALKKLIFFLFEKKEEVHIYELRNHELPQILEPLHGSFDGWMRSLLIPYIKRVSYILHSTCKAHIWRRVRSGRTWHQGLLNSCFFNIFHIFTFLVFGRKCMIFVFLISKNFAPNNTYTHIFLHR